MENINSTLFLLGDTARNTDKQDECIQEIIKKSLKNNKDHRVAVIDGSDLPRVRIIFMESSTEKTLQEENLNSGILDTIKEYMDKGNVTVLIYLSRGRKEWISVRASMTWLNVHSL